MAVLSLKVLNREGNTLCVSSGEEFVSLVYTAEYQEGDRIVLETSEKNIHIFLQADDAMGSAFLYITGNMDYKIPFGEKKMSYSPKAFSGGRHYLYAKTARKEEVQAYRNLALNAYDQHGNTNGYPHAQANVETRGESAFAARNTIDGVCETRSHGEWPYESWGINQRDDAELIVEFGREVEAEELVLYTRADFPHDNWWTEVTVTFSDQTFLPWELEKGSRPHVLTFEKKRITWLKISRLVKADYPSPYPALSQLEVYGRGV